MRDRIADPVRTTDGAAVSAVVAAATTAGQSWAVRARSDRALALEVVADHLDTAADELVPLALAETRLAEPRLRGELRRTTFQLRLFAEVVRDGSYLDARIDHADPDHPMGAPRPDLRRILCPLGPVLVFAASNFPFAFSVAGGDTASALAAGCAVVVKAHPGHPRLSAATGAIVRNALAAGGAPAGLFSVIVGDEAGRAALVHPQVRAAAFTGSISGGRALFDLACARPDPIPFYGEMGSINPVFVTRAAADGRADEIAAGFIGSFTLGAGQFCTKPGVLAAPRGSAVVAALARGPLPDPSPLLNERIETGFREGLGELRGHPAVAVLNGTDGAAGPPAATVLRVSLPAVLAEPEVLLQECFGPAALVVEYDDETGLLALADVLDGQLTATLVAEPDDEIVPDLLDRLSRKAGRVLWNQWPTGVSVTDAQQHGGPYPATTAPTSTSVGTAAIDRFLRPVAYQGFPQHLLPPELRDDQRSGPARRVDGQLISC